MNPTPTPHNAQPPQWRKITPDCQPQFPCWLWGNQKYPHWMHAQEPEILQYVAFTYWSPDSPTAPEGRPEETTYGTPVKSAVTTGATQDAALLSGPRKEGAKVPSVPPFRPASSAETATPTPETDGDCVKRINEGSQAWVRADFARRLERERDQARRQRDELAIRHCNVARLLEVPFLEMDHSQISNAIEQKLDAHLAQLKSMTDQFLAVSGQLGEARKDRDDALELHDAAIREAYKLLDIEDDGELRWKWVLSGVARLRAENKALRELLSRFRYWTEGLLQDLPEKRDWFDPSTEDNLRQLVQETAHLAQSDSPGAGVKGERS